jgi:hypothetical protein
MYVKSSEDGITRVVSALRSAIAAGPLVETSR